MHPNSAPVATSVCTTPRVPSVCRLPSTSSDVHEENAELQRANAQLRADKAEWVAYATASIDVVRLTFYSLYCR